MRHKKIPPVTATPEGPEPERTSREHDYNTTNRGSCQISRARKGRARRMENELLQKPGYWAVIPAKVRYDENLRPNAKLIYAEITALSNAEGYCWASNDRLAEWYGISPKTVGSLIQQLAQKGYITVELLRDDTRAITGRRIWIDRPADGVPPILKNEETPLKNEDTPLLKNEEDNNTRLVNKPPKAPHGGRSAKRETLSEPKWKPERFQGFWQYYPLHTSKQAAMRAWDRLKPADQLIDQIAKALQRQRTSDMWTRGFGIPYAATYLNQRRWEDEPDPVPDPISEEEAIPWL